MSGTKIKSDNKHRCNVANADLKRGDYVMCNECFKIYEVEGWLEFPNVSKMMIKKLPWRKAKRYRRHMKEVLNHGA